MNNKRNYKMDKKLQMNKSKVLSYSNWKVLSLLSSSSFLVTCKHGYKQSTSGNAYWQVKKIRA
jgi:hypothetical protein